MRTRLCGARSGSSQQWNVYILSFSISIVQKLVPDIKIVLYELLFQLLLNNWRYFFPATVLSHMDGDAVSEPMEHETQFLGIMEVKEIMGSAPFFSPWYMFTNPSSIPPPMLQTFGHSFLQSDITVFKQNLAALEILHSKHKLYSKVPVSQTCSAIIWREEEIH